MSGLRFSSLILAVVLAASGAYSQEIVLAENGIQGILNWTACAGEQAIRVERLSLAGCANLNCVLKMNQNYLGNFTMSPRNSHNSIKITVEAGNTVLLSTVLPTKLNATVNYIVTFPLIFDSRFARNNSAEYQTVRVSVTGTNRTEVCRTFPVYVDSFVPRGNSQNKYGESCTFANTPCNFSNSMCISRTCKCDSLSVENSKECKRRVGVPCWNNSNCLKNGQCQSGVCNCKSNYKPSSTGEKCSSGTEAITFSVVLIALQQMLVFFRKW